ncbi:Uncharacterised protein [Vibrio cholerae]|nr:Uncharacterised protein [Vibrio cholerae]
MGESHRTSSAKQIPLTAKSRSLALNQRKKFPDTVVNAVRRDPVLSQYNPSPVWRD